MWTLAALLGIEPESWSVIVAVAALAIAAYGAFGARGAVKDARRSADATTASAEASQRAAGAAEISAQHSERSAEAAERLAAASERAVELEERRAAHEGRERAARDAPRWEPVGDDEGAWWISDDNHLDGVLLNSGRVDALVLGITLDLPAGGQLSGRYRAEPPGPADGGFVSLITVRAGGAMRISFGTTDGSLGLGIAGDVRPRVTVTAESAELGWEGERVVELLRRSGGTSSATRWEPRAID